MTRLATTLWALTALFALARWLRRREAVKAQPDLTGYDALDEGDDGIQPPDPRPVYLVGVGRDSEWVGTFSQN